MVSEANSALSPIALMRREMTAREGAVPGDLDGMAVPLGQHRIAASGFLLRAAEVSFLYRPGEGVVIQRGPGWTAGIEELYLHGSVCAAVACLNGFLPLHASAVVVDDRVVAFTAPAGGGKSTLAAALARLGRPLFCDDTLVTALAPDGSLACLPGHKRMKLWPEAVELTGSAALEQVSADYRKVYVTGNGSDCAEMLPLGALVVLEQGAAPELAPVTGGAKIALLTDDHYCRQFYHAVNGVDGPGQFAFQARLAAATRVFRFARPFDRERFGETTGFLDSALSAMVRG